MCQANEVEEVEAEVVVPTDAKPIYWVVTGISPLKDHTIARRYYTQEAVDRARVDMTAKGYSVTIVPGYAEK